MTPLAVQSISGRTIRADEGTESLAGDVLQMVATIVERELSLDEGQQVMRNAREILVGLYRLYGLDLASQAFGNSPRTGVPLDPSEELAGIARRNLSEDIAEVLLNVISGILHDPSDDQAATLVNWSLAYLGMQVMNLDPAMRELQQVRFANKIFLLDTDFVLDCIVREHPRSSLCVALIENLVRLGCRVIIPRSCIDECVKHAAISPRTYHFFGSKLLSMSEFLVDIRVWNVFVAGYYYGRVKGMVSSETSYDRYLENYSDRSSPLAFFTRVVRDRLPEEVAITEVDTLLVEELDEKMVSSLTSSLATVTSKRKKSEYRSPEQIEDLARTDARLFLAALQLSKESARTESLLGGCCYVVTSSSKYVQCAEATGLRDVVTSRPEALLALLEVIGGFTVSPEEYLWLFENPLVAGAVEQVWPDVEVMLDSGIELRDRSLARLKWDLDRGIHDRITALVEADADVEGEREGGVPGGGDKEFTELIKAAGGRGYGRIPELDVFLQELEETEARAESLQEAYDELLQRHERLEEQITYFGKRKQRYLRRIADGDTSGRQQKSSQ